MAKKKKRKSESDSSFNIHIAWVGVVTAILSILFSVLIWLISDLSTQLRLATEKHSQEIAELRSHTARTFARVGTELGDKHNIYLDVAKSMADAELTYEQGVIFDLNQEKLEGNWDLYEMLNESLRPIDFDQD